MLDDSALPPSDFVLLGCIFFAEGLRFAFFTLFGAELPELFFRFAALLVRRGTICERVTRFSGVVQSGAIACFLGLVVAGFVGSSRGPVEEGSVSLDDEILESCSGGGGGMFGGVSTIILIFNALSSM